MNSKIILIYLLVFSSYSYAQTCCSGGFFKDNSGTIRSVFGNVISGSQTNLGDYLTPANSVVSFWFAMGAFYPEPEIYVP